VHNQSSMLCTFLDASKAFDSMHYSKLIKLLLSHKMPAYVIFVSLNFVCVCWCGIMSEYFLAFTEVKQ